MNPILYLDAATLLSASDHELEKIHKLSKEEAEIEARKLVGDSWVDEYFEVNLGV